jgi:hypothetical protein
MAKRQTLREQIAALTGEVRRLREEVAALRAAPGPVFIFPPATPPTWQGPVWVQPTWQPLTMPGPCPDFSLPIIPCEVS